MVESVVINSGGDIYDLYHLSPDLLFRVERISDREDFEVNDYTTSGWTEALALGEKGQRFPPSGYSQLAGKGERLFLTKSGVVQEYGIQLAYAHEVSNTSEDLRGLMLILLLLVPAAALIAWASGSAFARRALKPIGVLSEKVQEITAESLGERLPVESASDEIGRLAVVFNNLLARLDASFAQLKRFSADVAHELRTPLTAIRSKGEVALRAEGNERDAREAISSILEETEYITRILDNLLLLARGDAGTAILSFKTIDLSALVAEVAADLKILAEEKQQHLAVNTGAAIEAYVDPTTVRQALYNILDNAIKYAPAGGNIELSVGIGAPGQAVIEVKDDGPGIPAEDRERVFERFYRLDKARSRNGGGVGLGLAIAKWAIEANHGRIEFVAAEGWGSCCHVVVPRQNPANSHG